MLEILAIDESSFSKSQKSLSISRSLSAKTLTRSRSFTTLFTEDDVVEVPAMDNGSPKSALFRSPPSSPGPFYIHVQDVLLGKSLRVKISPSTTFDHLRSMIQSAQIKQGLRLLPTQAQRLTVDGVEYPDTAPVHSLVGGSGGDSAPAAVLVEPRVGELVSFFLAGVCDLRESDLEETSVAASPVVRSDSEHICIFGEMDDLDFSLDGVGGGGGSGGGSSGSDACSFNSALTPLNGSSPARSPCLSPPLATADGAAGPFGAGGLGRLQNALDALSGQVTPNRADRAAAAAAAAASSLDERAALAALFSSAVAGLAPRGPAGAPLRALLLREAVVPEEGYASHLHLLLRGDAAACAAPGGAAPLLGRFRWEELAELAMAVQSGLRHGHAPRQGPGGAAPGRLDYGELVAGCCGGTYLMSGAGGRACAVFKPADEEPYAPLNPKGYAGSSMGEESAMKPGIAVGGGAPRECAAFLLDHEGRAGVPCTGMVRLTHSTLLRGGKAEVQLKAGSLQRFVPHECTSEDVGTALFDADQVHAIGIFDMRTFNMDRNSDNLLVVRGGGGGGDGGAGAGARLVPIDHGYILPSYRHLEDVHCCWLYWPQARAPYSAATRAAIAALDPLADAALLRAALGLPAASLVTLVAGTVLVRAAADAGLTLHATGRLMVRSGEGPSPVERAVATAVERCGGGSAAEADLAATQRALEATIGEMVALAAAGGEAA